MVTLVSDRDVKVAVEVILSVLATYVTVVVAVPP